MTGETVHRFQAPDGESSVHATREDALGAAELWQAMSVMKDLDTLRQAAERGQMGRLAAPGMASEGAEVSDEAREVFTGDPYAKDVIDGAAMESRIALHVYNEAPYTPESAAAPRVYRVRAMRYSKATLDGAYQGVIRFFKGRDIADVFEDFSEDALARGLAEGLIDGGAVLRDLRKVEQATGMPLLPPHYGYDPAAGAVDAMPLLEGFSKLARAHAWGNVRTGALPEKTARWMDMLVATQAGMLRKGNALIHSDLARAGQFKEALARGEVPAELEKLLGESIGIGKVPEGAGPQIGLAIGVSDPDGASGAASLSIDRMDLPDPSETGSLTVSGFQSSSRPASHRSGDTRERELSLSENHKKHINEEVYKMSLKKTLALRGTAEREWEVANTGGYNILIVGGGTEYKADDVVGDAVVDAKYVGDPKISPYVDGSSMREDIRALIRGKIERGFARMAAVIEDPSNPLVRVEIVVNHPAAIPYFVGILKKFELDGRIVVR